MIANRKTHGKMAIAVEHFVRHMILEPPVVVSELPAHAKAVEAKFRERKTLSLLTRPMIEVLHTLQGPPIVSPLSPPVPTPPSHAAETPEGVPA